MSKLYSIDCPDHLSPVDFNRCKEIYARVMNGEVSGSLSGLDEYAEETAFIKKQFGIPTRQDMKREEELYGYDNPRYNMNPSPQQV
jgi:hypothetical protein